MQFLFLEIIGAVSINFWRSAFINVQMKHELELCKMLSLSLKARQRKNGRDLGF
jgi:hypothetical protein